MNIEVSGIHYEIDENTLKYVLKRFGRLEKYLPRHARQSATLEVKLKQVNREHGNKYEAEVILVAPHKVMTASDSTVNMMAAIDIVEAKIANQLRRYKDVVQKDH